MTQETTLPAPADLSAVLSVLQEAAALVATGRATPSRVRLEALGVVVEVSWPDGGPEPAAVRPPATPVTVTGPQHTNGGVPVAPAAPAPATGDEYVLTAPTVGVFYVAPEPGAPPFVTVGDQITKGQQVGIVEAMKLLIPVEADRSGRVVAVIAENGDPVEFGQPLISLAP